MHREKSRSILILFILSFLPFAGISQNDNIEYNQIVNQATRAYFHKDYTESSEAFTRAFETVEIPFASDLVNCFHANRLGGFDEKNESILLMLFKKFSLSIPQLIEFLPAEYLTKSQFEFLQLNKNTLTSNINHGLRENFKDLINDRSHYENNVLADKFIKLCSINGFPDEDNCGLFLEYQKTIWQSVILIYQHGLKSDRRMDMLELIHRAFQDGKIPSLIYGSILDYDHHNNQDYNMNSLYLASTISQVDGGWFKPFIYYEDDIINNIESNRNLIGMDSIHIVQNYIICNKLCPDSPSFYTAGHHVEDFPRFFVEEAFLVEGLDLEEYRIIVDDYKSDCSCK